jgi:hypothetical protein
MTFYSLSKFTILSRSFCNGNAKVTDQFTIKNAYRKKIEGFFTEKLTFYTNTLFFMMV